MQKGPDLEDVVAKVISALKADDDGPTKHFTRPAYKAPGSTGRGKGRPPKAKPDEAVAQQNNNDSQNKHNKRKRDSSPDEKQRKLYPL